MKVICSSKCMECGEPLFNTMAHVCPITNKDINELEGAGIARVMLLIVNKLNEVILKIDELERR